MGSSFTNTAIIAAGGGILLGYVAARLLRQREEFTPPPIPRVDANRTPPAPLWEGPESDPKGVQLLSELRDYLVERVGSEVLPTVDLVRLPRAGLKKRAIPPRQLWPNMAATLYYIVRPMKQAAPDLYLRSGYRPPWYNEKVNGAPKSLHQWFAAVDVKTDDQSRMDAAVQVAARLYVWIGERLKMGFGVYHDPPKRVHVDLGWKQRSWENASKWIQKAQGVS